MPLIFQSTAVARPAYYDRNPVTLVIGYGPSNTAPAAATNRTSYTVPVGKKAWLDMLWLQAWRQTVASVLSPYYIIAQYTPNGGVSGPIYRRPIFTNNVNDLFNDTLFNMGYMNPGDLIQLQTDDASTAGLVQYTFGCKATQFDQ